MRLCLFSIVLSLIVLSSQAQSPLSGDIIDIDSISLQPSKSLPFDRAFTLAVSGIDFTRISGVFAVPIVFEKGKKSLDFQNVLKLEFRYNEKAKKIFINIPPIKPNRNFDVFISQKLSDDQFTLLFQTLEDIPTGNDVEGDALFKKLIAQLVNKANNTITFPVGTYLTFKTSSQSAAWLPYIIAADNSTGLTPANVVPLVNITSAITVGNQKNINVEALFALSNFSNATTINDVSLGLLNVTSSKTCQTWDYKQRLYNLTIAANMLDSSKVTLMKLYTLSLDQNVLTLLNMVVANDVQVHQNSDVLTSNFGKLVSSISTEVSSQTVTIVNSTDFKDLETKSAAVLSTDIGLTTLVVRNNLNEVNKIPRIFFGVDIFFRAVDRNLRTKYIPTKPKGDVNDLLAYRSIFHSLNLSVGLTVGGSLNTPDFSNLYNNLSLTVGPSYRFGQAFRISTGMSILKRVNPNPIITTDKVTTGGYVSLSVDLAFAKVIQNIIDLIK